jgi:uroporphyrinogen decarboxylase
MAAMTHRERVMTALDHREPDRVPLDLWGSATSVNDGIYFRTKQYLGIEGDITPVRQGKTSNYYDERILEAFDIDFRHVMMKGARAHKHVVRPDGSFDDEWGVTWQERSGHIGQVRHPLQTADIDDLKRHPWPDAHAPGRTDGLRDWARRLREETDFCVVCRAAPNFGTFDRCCSLRGTEQFMIDMMVDRRFAHALVDCVAKFEYELNEVLLDAAGDYLDIVCWAEDFGYQDNLLIPPRLYREYFKPHHTQLIAMIKRKAPHVHFQFHSCGAVRNLIPDLIEIGVDILQSVQPAKNMDSEELKREFGDDLIFHGAIDIQYALPGTLEDIDAEVRRRIAAFAPGGGYILAPANNVQDDTPAENLVHMYRAASEYGRYPINL